jgi:hypothetical protein
VDTSPLTHNGNACYIPLAEKASSYHAYGPKKRKATDSGKFYKADVEKGYFIPITDWMKPMH